MKILCIAFLMVSIFSSGNAFSQAKDSAWRGSLNGIVRDSINNYVLRSATVAIYMVNNSELLGYTLCNNYGEFSFKKLPTGIPLKIVATFVGYKSNDKTLIISSLKNELDIGHINLTISPNEQSEVIVTSTPPPVRMKGDTLEFNADAFKLDPNAQTEDLLRMLPGITIWADGEITVNGRKVSSVLVNGKPFFGRDARIATQNIPKNAVDKIQVYQKGKDPLRAIIDSITEINIKLKKGKDVGYFGKVSSGFGTNKRYESDGSINFFNPKSQLGVALVSNNTNKAANDIDFILRNNTYKGTGANAEYQSDFNAEGLNNYIAGGLIYQHDFILHPDYYNNNRFTALYFAKKNRQQILKNMRTITYVNDTTSLTQQNIDENSNTQISHNASATYEKLRNGNTISVNTKYSNNSTSIANKNQWLSFDEKQHLLSTNTYFNDGTTTVNNVSITTGFRHNGKRQEKILSNYNISYTIRVNENKNINLSSSEYKVIQKPALNADVVRLYNNSNKSLSHNLTFELPGLMNKLLKNVNFHTLEAGFKNEMYLSGNKVSGSIKDKDTVTNHFLLNTYLTNNRRQIIVDDKPSFTFNKSILKSLNGRYMKLFNAEFIGGAQFYDLHSTSDKRFQQFNKNYVKFLSALNINYTNRQFGTSANSYSMRFNTSSDYPDVQQLAPLTDSINQYFLEKGNPLLKEQNNRSIYLSFYHNSEDGKNDLSYHIFMNAGTAKNYFTSSTYIDSFGRTTYTTVNADGYRMANIAAEIKRAIKIKNNQLQFAIKANADLNRQPAIVNGVLNFYNNSVISYNPSINYTSKSWLAINFLFKKGYSRYIQQGINGNSFTNINNQLGLSCNINVTKKISLNSNAIYTKNNFNNLLIRTFTIWNANASYRFLKANTAEIKFAAMDILGQNTGLINEGVNNSITQGTQNLLQQYFMITLAYFPRKFGK